METRINWNVVYVMTGVVVVPGIVLIVAYVLYFLGIMPVAIFFGIAMVVVFIFLALMLCTLGCGIVWQCCPEYTLVDVNAEN